MLSAGYRWNLHGNATTRNGYLMELKIQYIKIYYFIIDIWSCSLKTIAELAQYLLSDSNLKWHSESHLCGKKIL